MILNGFNLAQGFQDPETETPPRGWRRTGGAIPGGAQRETPALGWRRADDTLTGGVNAWNYRCATSRCQGGLTPEGQDCEPRH